MSYPQAHYLHENRRVIKIGSGVSHTMNPGFFLTAVFFLVLATTGRGPTDQLLNHRRCRR